MLVRKKIISCIAMDCPVEDLSAVQVQMGCFWRPQSVTGMQQYFEGKTRDLLVNFLGVSIPIREGRVSQLSCGRDSLVRTIN